MTYKRKFIKKSDIIIIISIIIIASIFYFINTKFINSEKNIKAEITINNEKKYIVDLNEDKIFYLNENQNIMFEIKNKKIRFESSDCPDKICVKTGFIGKKGQSAVCLPNKVSIKIISDNKTNNDIDVII